MDSDSPSKPKMPSKRFPNYGSTLKERLRLMVDEPTSGVYAFIFSIIIGFSIVLSSTTTVVETLPQFTKVEWVWAPRIDYFCATIFTLELLLRFWANFSTTKTLLKWCLSLFTIIDVLSLLPFYIYLLTASSSDPNSCWNEMQNIGVLRLFKLLRIFRCYNYSSMLQLSMDALLLAIKKSTDALVAMVVFLSFMMITFSTLIYYLERGTLVDYKWIDVDGEESKFNSIPASMYFVIEVITTVGLGDCHPLTWMGKLCTSFLMILSLLFMALPSILIGRNFSESWAWLRSTRPHRLKAKSRRINPLTRRPFNEDHLVDSAHSGRDGNGDVGAAADGNDSDEKDDGYMMEERDRHSNNNHIYNNNNSNNNRNTNTDNINTVIDITEDQNNQLTVTSMESITTIQTPPPRPNDFEDHGDVDLAILEELQRQNELLERILLSNHKIKTHQKKTLEDGGIGGSIGNSGGNRSDASSSSSSSSSESDNDYNRSNTHLSGNESSGSCANDSSNSDLF